MNKLSRNFYLQNDVVNISRELLGKLLFTNISGIVTAGMITETEAYEGVTDKASHAYGGRKTKRTEIMFNDGGVAYVYLCYGIHSLFNIVTNVRGIPHAVLIRGIRPEVGVDEIIKRRNSRKIHQNITNGPGKVSGALGIDLKLNGDDLCGDKIWLEESSIKIPSEMIHASKRIGIDYAGEDANLLYRFNLIL